MSFLHALLTYEKKTTFIYRNLILSFSDSMVIYTVYDKVSLKLDDICCVGGEMKMNDFRTKLPWYLALNFIILDFEMFWVYLLLFFFLVDKS